MSGNASIKQKHNSSTKNMRKFEQIHKKHKTIIDDGVFVGSNCSLIAPIKISKNSSLGAGSVITKNVPISSLAVERSKLLIKRKKK